MKNWTSLKNKRFAFLKLCFANFSLQYSKFSALSNKSLSSDTNRPNRKTSVLLSLLLWRYWLAVEVGDKCVTKLSSFWCEDRLLCSHSCFFSLSLLPFSPFVCELFCTLFPFHIHIFFFSFVSPSFTLFCHLLCFSIVLFDFSPLFVDCMLEVS